MRAIAYTQAGPIDRADALIDREMPDPAATGRDLLVEVRAVSVNPVDTKIRSSVEKTGPGWRVQGFDAAGVVRAAGPDATLFQPGDAVFYAGSLIRPGTDAELHLVDERIVGAKPGTLDWGQAAALPLTAVTAWEALFDRLDVARPVPGVPRIVLVIGGAGGVGSIAVQLARQLTDLTIIATASRPETQAWVLEMGAHHVIDHSRPIAPQVAALGIGAPSFIFSTTQTGQHLADCAEAIAPQGRFALIDDPASFDLTLFKRKSVSVHWEYMFTRSTFGTADMAAQGRILGEVAALVDAGKLRSTLNNRLSPINAANLIRAHAMIESGTTRGKIILEGWT
ncbi:zinc-binding alcohol dehydrogenase family protein [soil metagenome]